MWRALLLSIAIVACAGTHEAADVGLDAWEPRFCITHGDCDVGAFCDPLTAHCAPSTMCTSDTDCTAGQWCDFRATCVPHVPPVCRDGADCAATELCIENRCVALVDTCQFAYDCPPGTACVDARCIAVCTSDVQCAIGARCNTTSHFCEPRSRECTTSNDCANGRHCVEGRCLPPCTGSDVCPESGREAAYCAADSFCHPAWQIVADCPADTCPPRTTCVGHICRTTCPTTTDMECTASDSTLPYCRRDDVSGLYLCYAEATPPIGQCRSSADCPPARPTCVNASCQ